MKQHIESDPDIIKDGGEHYNIMVEYIQPLKKHEKNHSCTSPTLIHKVRVYLKKLVGSLLQIIKTGTKYGLLFMKF